MIPDARSWRTAAAMKRPANPMPDDVAAALEAEGLRTRYDARPWYQRNDYLGWIARARRAETRQKRFRQMLDELRAGDVYMKMAWHPRR
jgi:uncharacterized protein YdeI (YjbR/CyaY-like superfamily)